MAVKGGIQRVQLEIEIPSEKDFDDISKTGFKFLNKWISDLVQKVLNELNPNGDYIINRLEIDLKIIDFQNPEEIKKNLYLKLKKEISSILHLSEVNSDERVNNYIIEFIKKGRFGWRFDEKKELINELSKVNFTSKIGQEITLLISNSEQYFYRFKNLLDPFTYEKYLKNTYKKTFTFYTQTFKLLDNLIHVNKDQLVTTKYNKKKLEYYFIKTFIKKNENENEILYAIIDEFEIQTGQEIEELINLSKKSFNKKNQNLKKLIDSFTDKLNKRNNIYSETDSFNIITNYFAFGHDFLPYGYTNKKRLEILLQLVLKKNKQKLINHLRSPDFTSSSIKTSRLLQLLNENEIRFVDSLLSKQKSKISLEILDFIKDMGLIKNFENFRSKPNFYDFKVSFYQLLLSEDITSFSNQYFFKKVIKTIALDYNIDFKIYIAELLLSPSIRYKKHKFKSYLENIYIENINNSQSLISFLDISNWQTGIKQKNNELSSVWSISEKKIQELDILKFTFFQRKALNYFMYLLTNKKYINKSNKGFLNTHELLKFITEIIRNTKSDSIKDLSLLVFIELEKIIKIDLSEIINSTVKELIQREGTDYFDYELLSKFTNEINLSSIDLKKKNPLSDVSKVNFKYEHSKKLSSVQKRVSSYLLETYSYFSDKKKFILKFNNVIEFEKFLQNVFHNKSEDRFIILFDNILSEISIETKTSYKELVRCLLISLNEKIDKRYTDIEIFNKYRTSSTYKFSPEENLLKINLEEIEQYQLTFAKKALILFLLTHLKNFLNKSSVKLFFPKQKNVIPFLISYLEPTTSISIAEASIHILDNLALKTKNSFNDIIKDILFSIKNKKIKTSLSYDFVSFYEEKNSVDPERQKNIYLLEKEKELNLTYYQKKNVGFFLKLFLNFKNQSKYINAFTNESNLIEFILSFNSEGKALNFEDLANLLIKKFSEKTKIKINNIRLILIDKITLTKDSDDLSNRLLSHLLLKVIEQSRPQFDFGKTNSSIRSIDDLMLRIVNLQKIYRPQLLQLLYFPGILNKIKENSFEQILKKIAFPSKLNYFELLKNIIKNINASKKNESKNKYRFVAIKILLDKKKKITSEYFTESIIEHLLFINPSLFKNKSLPKEIETIFSENTDSNEFSIKQILNRILKQKEIFKNRFHEESSEINQFEFLLHHKNDILITKDPERTLRIEKELASFEIIISNPKSLLTFLKNYGEDPELLIAFTELGLSKTNKNTVDLQINNLNKKFTEIIDVILDIQNTMYFSNLNKEAFEIILRAYLYKKIGLLKSVKKFEVTDFTYAYLEYLSNEKYLNYRSLLQMEFYKSSNYMQKDIQNTFRIFVDRGVYFGVNKRVGNNLFFKDLSFAILKYNSIPEWAITKNFTKEDALVYVSSRVELQDKDFTQKLMIEKNVITNLSKVFVEKSLSFHVSLFKQIQNPKIGFDFSVKYEKLINYFLKRPWNKKVKIIPFFYTLFIKKELWKNNSLLQLSDKIAQNLENETEWSSKKLKKEIEKALIISPKLLNLRETVDFSLEEQGELAKFFLETGDIPISLRIHKQKIISQIVAFLKSSDIETKNIWRYYLNLPKTIDHVLMLISKKDLIKNIKEKFFEDSDSEKAFGVSLFKTLENIEYSNLRLSRYLNLINEYLIGKGIKKSKIQFFIKKLKNQDIILFNALTKEMKKLEKNNKIEFLPEISLFLSELSGFKINSSDVLNSVSQILDEFEYYIEFGSTKFENKQITLNELYLIFNRLIKEENLLIKKRLHQWGNSKEKIRRIIKLYPDKQKNKLFDIIHPDLKNYLLSLDELTNKKYNKSLPFLLSLKNWEELIIYSYGFWNSTNLILENTNELIKLFIEQLLNQLNLVKEDFVSVLKENTDMSIDNHIKKQLILCTLQLKQKTDVRKTEEIKKLDSTTTEIDESDSIFIGNAGLILLWPFLNRLYDKLGLLEGKIFIDQESQQKAILLSDYLVTGNLDFKESDLILNKLICGAPLNMFVDVNMPLDQFELDLCESLLKGVLQNWDKLNNSSIKALRDTFLIRDGVLRKSNANYDLIIKKKPFDVLLNTLPWNISMIQTSFMKNRILVEWI